jgi:hypothetical protein
VPVAAQQEYGDVPRRPRAIRSPVSRAAGQLLRRRVVNGGRDQIVVNESAEGPPGVVDQIDRLQAAARKLGLQLVIVNARDDSDLETAFATLSQQYVGAVLVGGVLTEWVDRGQRMVSRQRRELLSVPQVEVTGAA